MRRTWAWITGRLADLRPWRQRVMALLLLVPVSVLALLFWRVPGD